MSFAVVAVSVTFWACVALVVYAYVGYPLLLWVLSRIAGRRRVPPTEQLEELPFVSVIIAAHNEESVIGPRLDNLLALDYPAERYEVLIASDGSTDATEVIVARCRDARVRLLASPVNRGKVAVLGEAVAAARGDVLVLSDANTVMDTGVLKNLVRWFASPDVGVVCGRLVLIDPVSGRNVDGLYWKYETFLKACEDRLGALLGANGGIYATRRSMFPELPSKIAIDDFVIPLLAKLRQGCGILYDQDAVAYEETPPHIRDEFRRRSRIGAGGFQSLALLWPLLNPFRGWVAFAFLSHKIVRWVCPFFLLGVAAATVAGMLVAPGDALYIGALVLQLALYSAAYAGYYISSTGIVPRLVRLATMFTTMNLALMVGFFVWISGRQGGTWRRTTRVGHA